MHRLQNYAPPTLSPIVMVDLRDLLQTKAGEFFEDRHANQKMWMAILASIHDGRTINPLIVSRRDNEVLDGYTRMVAWRLFYKDKGWSELNRDNVWEVPVQYADIPIDNRVQYMAAITYYNHHDDMFQPMGFKDFMNAVTSLYTRENSIGKAAIKKELESNKDQYFAWTYATTDDRVDFDTRLKALFSAKRAKNRPNTLLIQEGAQAEMKEIALRREQLQQEQREHQVMKESHIVNAHRNKGVGGWRSRQDVQNTYNLLHGGIWPSDPMGEDDAELLQAMVDECMSILRRYGIDGKGKTNIQ